ncbi:Aldo keto reductase [Rhodotorula diobovata]|uniref:Aldo keto reductase n=1 Tax=Rhodotorula diobovata TaxID=5288 RepID=A0A5C5G0P3_9BASI|nr:Aldo keto reductase [Rhodotorula diobovata]
MPTTLEHKVTEYPRFGKSALRVSKVILGCMSYGNKGWANWVLEGEEALEHFKVAYELGINTWDTANVYSNGDSERLVGQAITKFSIPREHLVIMTKLCMVVADDPHTHPSKIRDPDQSGYVNRHGLSRKHIFDSVDQSLARLGLEYIDVLQVHRLPRDSSIEELMVALHDVVKSGKVRYIGMSSCYAYEFHAMQAFARENKLTQFVSMQPHYSAIYREEEREMFPTCDLFGAAIIPWSPLARGFLTRPHREQDSTERAKSDPNYARFVGLGNEAEEEALHLINEAVEKIAKDRGVSMAQVALAWQFSNPVVTAPIVGSTRIEALREAAAATHLKLTDEEVKAISEPYRPRGILGH